MANVRIPLPTLYGGVSRQADTTRHPNQVQDADNTIFTVKDGLAKRPGAKFLMDVPTSLSAAGAYRLHPVKRDENEQYLFIYGDSTLGILRVNMAEPDTVIAVSNVVGTFQAGEEVTEGVTAATGTFYHLNGASDTMYLFETSGTFTGSQTLTGGTSGATADGGTLSANPGGHDWQEAKINGLASGDAKDYLDANDAGPDDLRLVTIADHTLLLNNTVQVQAKQSDLYEIADQWRNYEVLTSHNAVNDSYYRTQEDGAVYTAGYWQHSSGSGATFEVYQFHNVTGVFKTLTTYTNDIRNPGGCFFGFKRLAMTEPVGEFDWVNGTKRLGLAASAKFASYTWQEGDQINIDGGSVTAGWYEIASRVDDDWIELVTGPPEGNQGDVETNGIGHQYEMKVDFRGKTINTLEDLALEFQRGLRDAGCQHGLIYYESTGENTGRFCVVSPYGGTDSDGIIMQASATAYDWQHDGADDRPFERYATIDTVAGTGDASNLIYPIEDRWTRKPPPDQNDAELDETTMPIKIVRTTLNPLVFTVSTIEWGFRENGDPNTNPVPSLWQNQSRLADICFHRNRLVIAGDENVVFSQAGEFYKFYIEDEDNIGDADPIDIALSTDQVTLVDFLIPFRQALVIFTKGARQFELNTPDSLTPETAAITPSTANNSLSDTRPAVMGNRLYFLAVHQDVAQVMEYFYDDSAMANAAADITAHVQGYLPQPLHTIAVATNENAVFVLPDNSYSIYVYRAFWQGIEKVQSAWSRYVFNGTDRIVDIAVIEDDCFLLSELTAGDFIISRLPVVDEDAPSDMPYPVLLDNRMMLQGSHSAGVTTWDTEIVDTAIDRIVLSGDFAHHARDDEPSMYWDPTGGVSKADVATNFENFGDCQFAVIACWLKVNNTDIQRSVYYESVPGLLTRVNLLITAGKLLRVFVRTKTGDGGASKSIAGALQLNTWHCILIAVDGVNQKVYAWLDGEWHTATTGEALGAGATSQKFEAGPPSTQRWGYGSAGDEFSGNLCLCGIKGTDSLPTIADAQEFYNGPYTWLENYFAGSAAEWWEGTEGSGVSMSGQAQEADLSLSNITWTAASTAADAGDVLIPERADNNTLRISGDYSAGKVYAGRTYTMDVTLSRPYYRGGRDSAVLDGTLQLHKFLTNHRNTGSYILRVDPDSGANRDSTFTPSGTLDAEGSFQTFVRGHAQRTTLHIVSDQPVPCIIGMAEFIATFTPRSQ